MCRNHDSFCWTKTGKLPCLFLVYQYALCTNHLPQRTCVQYFFIHEFSILSTWRPELKGCHFADDIFKYIFLTENVCILIDISLKFFLRVKLHWQISIGLGNNLVPNRQQATNVHEVVWYGVTRLQWVKIEDIIIIIIWFSGSKE